MGTLVFVCPTTGHEVSTGVEVDRSNHKGSSTKPSIGHRPRLSQEPYARQRASVGRRMSLESPNAGLLGSGTQSDRCAELANQDPPPLHYGVTSEVADGTYFWLSCR